MMITIDELRRALAEKGHAFGFGTIQRFFTRHAITRKKRSRVSIGVELWL